MFAFRPRIHAYAYAEDEAVAPRNAGWADLLSQDGDHRFGRGHLMLWPAEVGSERSGAEEATERLDKDAAQPVGEGSPNLRAELRDFRFDGEAPPIGADLLVRPEQEQDSYAVRVTEVEPGQDTGGRVALDWPDDRLPAALSELGGH